MYYSIFTHTLNARTTSADIKKTFSHFHFQTENCPNRTEPHISRGNWISPVPKIQ